MINHIQKTLLELISTSLFGIDYIRQDSSDWNGVLCEAKAQTVVAVASKAVPKEMASEWRECTLQNQAKFIRILHGQTQMVNMFAQARIPLVILKGTAAAVYYPEPFRRTMGDIDLIVPQDRYKEVIDLMSLNGYHQERQSARHTSFLKDGIEYELHHHFSYDDLDIEYYLINGLSHPDWGEIGTHRFPMLPPLANGLVLLAHLRSHLKTGVGLRQLIDWMMYVNRELDDEFWESEFQQVAESKGLATLAITATRFCQRYLGLSECITWCASADDTLSDQLLDLLFTSGNFGRKQGDGNSVETVSMRIRNLKFFRYLQIAGEVNWELYHRHPYLKPLCGGYQLFRIVKRGTNTGRGAKILRDIDRSKERYELLKSLGVFNDLSLF